MVNTLSNEHRLANFHQEAIQSLAAIGKKHGVNLQPIRAMAQEGALHLAMSITIESALEFYGRIWFQYHESLKLPSYLEPGMSVINPDTGDEWVLIGLDPASMAAPVRLMNTMFDHFWMDIDSAKELQPI
jgi:hypothetical protein